MIEHTVHQVIARDGRYRSIEYDSRPGGTSPRRAGSHSIVMVRQT